MEDVKMKLAVFWLVFFSVMVISPILELYLPGFVEEIIAGEPGGEPMTAEIILFLAIMMLIPPAMAVLSLTLKDSINRWLNIIMGIVFIVMMTLFTGFELIPTAYLGSILLIAIVEVVSLALIIWYA